MEVGLLSWVAPPLVGALLGWAASSFLLSRILHPAQGRGAPREVDQNPSQIAQEMGELVATELLSEEAIRKQLGSAGFQASLRRGTASITDKILSTPMGSLTASAGSTRFAPLLALLGEGLERGGRPLLKEIVRAAVARVVRTPLSGLVGEGSILSSLFDRWATGLRTGETKHVLRKRIDAWLEGLLAGETELAAYLSPQGVATVEETADALYSPIIEFLVRWLRTEETKRDLVIRGRFLVRDLLGRLTGIQRIIVSAAQFDRTIDENMPGIVGDALDAIEDTARDPETRKRLIAAMGDELRSARSRRLGELVGSNAETLKGVVAAMAERLLGLLSNPKGRENLLSLLAGPSGAGREGGSPAGGGPAERTLGDLLAPLLGLSAEDRSPTAAAGEAALRGDRPGDGAGCGDSVADFLTELLVARLEKGRATGAAVTGVGGGPSGGGAEAGGLSLQALLSAALSARSQDRVGDLLSLGREAKQGMDEALAQALVTTVDTHLSEILAGVDFRSLVARKIDEIEGGEMARFFLAGMGPQLRWFAVVGGLIGALAGAAADLAHLL